MMKRAAEIIIIFIISALIAGCAHNPAKDKADSRKMSAEKRKNVFALAPSDTAIMNDVLTCLNNRQVEPDYNAVKSKLENLIKEHPKSKLVDGAQALIRTVNDLLALQTEINTEKLALEKAIAEKSKLLKEKEAHKHLEEKYQQENEQMKKDIELLKKLEIQIDKREKMLK